MRLIFALWTVVIFVIDAEAESRGVRHAFFRSIVPRGGSDASRRVFGGKAADLGVYPATCVLLDRYHTVRCSASVVAPQWALTAAHCVTPQVAYVRYNTRHPTGNEGKLAPVHYLYRHPDYKVVNQDEGRGPDVTTLHNDVGLVRTSTKMDLDKPPPVQPLKAMKQYNLDNLNNEVVQVLGFGRTEQQKLGEELFEVKLQLVPCDRSTWFHCMCAISAPDDGSSGASRKMMSARGVCTGDSGGPVLYHGVQVGVTSLGPVECSASSSLIPEGATSVFTSLYEYADLVNATIQEKDITIRSDDSGCPPCLRTRFSVLAVTLAPILRQLVLIV